MLRALTIATLLVSCLAGTAADELRRLLEAGSYAEAAELGRSQLAEIDPRSLDHASVAELTARAMSSAGIGTLEARIALAQGAISVREQLLEAQELQLAEAHYTLGLVHHLGGDSARAVEPFRRALAIAELHHSREAPELERFVRELGAALLSSGEPRSARRQFERQLAIARAAYPTPDARLVPALYNLALAEEQLDGLSESERLLREALAQPEDPDARGRRRWVATALASTLAIQGRLAEALGQSESLLAATRADVTAEPSVLAWLLNDTGVMLRMAGDLQKARRYLEESIELQGSRPRQADLAMRSRSNLGVVLTEQERFDEARVVFESVPEVVAGRIEAGRSQWGEYHLAFGKLLLRAGATSEARSQLARAIEVLSATMPDDYLDLAVARGEMGRAEFALGAEERARALLEASLAVLDRGVGRQHPYTSRVLDARARVLHRDGDPAVALEAALEAERVSRLLRTETLAALSERQAVALVRRPTVGRDLAIALALGEKASAATLGSALDAVIRSRSAVFDELALRQQLREASDDERIEQLAEAKRRLAHQFHHGVGSGAAYMERLERLRERVESLETALAGSGTLRRSPQRVGLGDLRAALRRGDSLVSYVRYARADGERRYAGIVLRGDGSTPRFRDLGAADRIDADVQRWRATLHADEAEHRSAGLVLRRQLWDPLTLGLDREAALFVVPDGTVHLVSFAALPMPGARYLIEVAPELHYLTAERDLASKGALRRGEGILVVGNPDYDLGASRPAERSGARPGCLDLRDHRFVPLPATAEESEAVRRLWGASRATSVRRLQGSEATESAFRREASGAAVLHLATHGFVLEPDACRGGNRGLSRGVGGLSPAQRDSPEASTAAHPLLLSGLVFAGANARKRRGGLDDGILTALEVGTLDLRGVELAVLSACRTGAGHVEVGEGILGLRRAFRLAGVRSVVSTLWDVEDSSAHDWVVAFYRHHLDRERSVAASARSASLEILEQRRRAGADTHPFHWAGWLSGGGPG